MFPLSYFTLPSLLCIALISTANLRLAPLSMKTAALTAGTSLIITALAAFFSYGYAHGTLVNFEDAGATLDNLMSSSMLFKAEILGWLIVLICDIIVAWAFYVFLKPYHYHLSLLGAWFRLIYNNDFCSVPTSNCRPHCSRKSISGFNPFPRSVNSYSTLGGMEGYSCRSKIPASSSSLSCSASTLC